MNDESWMNDWKKAKSPEAALDHWLDAGREIFEALRSRGQIVTLFDHLLRAHHGTAHVGPDDDWDKVVEAATAQLAILGLHLSLWRSEGGLNFVRSDACN